MPTLRGVFLAPGVSKNGRYYSKALIGKAVTRMQERIADPDALPIVMRTSHSAGDRSDHIVARITGVHQDDVGRARYEAKFYDTAPARDIAALVHPADGGLPGLRSVSIAGDYLGEPRTVVIDGRSAQTADDMEVHMIDFTASPGVTAALIDPPAYRGESVPAARPGRTPIFESFDPRETPMSSPLAPMPDAQFQALLQRITEAVRPAATPILEADLTEASVARARTILEADAAIRTRTAEQTAITEAEQLRGLDTQQLGRVLAARLAAGQRASAPSWHAAFAARGGRTFFDA
jgi:hypothetical protein